MYYSKPKYTYNKKTKLHNLNKRLLMSTYANEKIKEYANEMPFELRRAMDALDDDIRLAIFFVLLKYGELPFSQIMKELEIPSEYSSKLSYHIKKLQKGALIKNEYVKKEGIDSYSFYDITEFGEGLLNNLIDTITVPTPSMPFSATSDTFSANSLTRINLKSESTQPKKVTLTNNTSVLNENQFEFKQEQESVNWKSIPVST